MEVEYLAIFSVWISIYTFFLLGFGFLFFVYCFFSLLMHIFLVVFLYIAICLISSGLIGFYLTESYDSTVPLFGM